MDPIAGALNMLRHCAQSTKGERVLIVRESPDLNYYAPDAIDHVRRAAEILGLNVDTLDVGFAPDSPQFTSDISERADGADIIVFLARLGDQLRFSEMPPGKRILVSFALDTGLLGSPFGTVHHGAMAALKQQVTDTFHAARQIRVTCPRGTDFRGAPDMPAHPRADTSLLRFPLSVFQPVPATPFGGRVALCGFLTGTGSRYYEPYTVAFDGPVTALFDKGRVVGFEGSAADVARANAQYDHVADRFGIDRDCVHSWHAGIHPGCGYHRPIADSYERWGGVAFGNPRVLHFHTCGAYPPGEISWNVIDPTIWVDDVALWERGVFHPERMAGGRAVLDSYPCAAKAFAHPDPAIGF